MGPAGRPQSGAGSQGHRNLSQPPTVLTQAHMCRLDHEPWESRMTGKNDDLIAWIDTETTGLDARSGLLLEIAVVVTTNDLTELGYDTVVVRPAAGIDDAMARMDEFVIAMHTGNRLIQDIQSDEALDAASADARIAASIRRIAGNAPLVLGGNSITLDRNFLQTHAPQTFAVLSYRSIDTSSIEEDMMRDGYGDAIDAWRAGFAPDDAHRALGDVRDSIRKLAALRRIRRQHAAH